jgi:hypothetical protein
LSRWEWAFALRYSCNLHSPKDLDPVVHKSSRCPYQLMTQGCISKRKMRRPLECESQNSSTTSICSYIVPNASATSFHSRESSNCTVNAMITSNATLNPHMQPSSYSTVRKFSSILVQKHLCLVDLGGQVRASAAIGVVLHDHGAVSLAHDLLVETAFSVENVVSVCFRQPRGSLGCRRMLTSTPRSAPPLSCSSSSRIRPCRMPCRARQCRHGICAMRQDQHDPMTC